MTHFGLTPAGAQIIDKQERGDQDLIIVLSQGVTERSAVRSARLEASKFIPFREQDVVRTIENGSAGMVRTRYMVTIGQSTR